MGNRRTSEKVQQTGKVLKMTRKASQNDVTAPSRFKGEQ